MPGTLLRVDLNTHFAVSKETYANGSGNYLGGAEIGTIKFREGSDQVQIRLEAARARSLSLSLDVSS